MNDSPKKSAEKRTGQRILFWLACLALLVVMICLGLNESGRSAWDNYRRQWEAKGERFDFASFIPKPVPDDQNFALAPIVASSYKRRILLKKIGILQIIRLSNQYDESSLKGPLKLEIYGDSSLVAECRPTASAVGRRE